jgi:hypothetical protein
MKASSKRGAAALKTDTPALKSALKPSSIKKSSKVTPNEKTPAPAPKIDLPDHKYKFTIVEAAIDFRKPAFSDCDNDPCKKTSFALKQLLTNFHIGDPTACLLNHSDLTGIHIGPGGIKVPKNMTALTNYCKGFNPKAFQTNSGGGGGDNLDSLGETGTRSNGGGGGGNKKKNNAIAYFLFILASNKEPRELVNQVSYEWGKFGPHARVKELQSMETETIYCIFFLFSQTSKSLLMEELKRIFKAIQDDMFDSEYHINDDSCAYHWAVQAIPEFNLRSQVPKLPRANTHAMLKLPGHLQTHRRQYHLEVDSSDKPFFKCLIEYGKRGRMFKDEWGQHVHLTEVVDYESAPGDCHRFEKFSKRSLNFNASLTSLELHGFLNLCNTIDIVKEGRLIASLSGKDCLTTIFKLANGSPLVVEVHQVMGGAPALVVFPNIPEAEAMITSFGKHTAGYALGYMLDAGMEEQFIWQFLEKFCDPSLVRTATGCVFDPKTKTITTPDELAEEEGAGALEEQSWFLDILKLEEEKANPKKKGYANEKVMFKFGEEQSLKTMHERNDVDVDLTKDADGEEVAEDSDGASSAGGSVSLSSVQKAGLKKKHLAEERFLDSREVQTVESNDGEDGEEFLYDEDRLQAELGGEKFPNDMQSGYTPKSGLDRLGSEDVDMASAGSSDSSVEVSNNLGNKAPASDAGSQTPTDAAGRSG